MKTPSFRTALLTAVFGLAAIGTIAEASARQKPEHFRGPHAERMHGGPMHFRGDFQKERLLERFDANKDGKITKDELQAALRAEYGKYNTGKDDKLTLAQYEKLWSDRMMERRVRAFQRYDINGDGKISLEEFQRPMARMASRMSKSDDGIIDLDKMGRRGPFMKERLGAIDTDKDGKITRAEIDAARKGQFEKYDTNKDGALSADEFEALWLERTQQPRVRSFQWLDRNGDAVVSFEEYSLPTTALFERLDRNNDGVIEKNELQRSGRDSRQNRRGDRDDGPRQERPSRNNR